MRFAILAVAMFRVSAIACQCPPSLSICDVSRNSAFAFVGRALEDSGDYPGTKAVVRVAVEEVLHGLPHESREVTAYTLARTSCYVRLREHERYIVLASRPGRGVIAQVSLGFCSTLPVEGNGLLLSALRSAERGGLPRLIGKVTLLRRDIPSARPAAGLAMIAARGETRFRALTNASGEFEFTGLTAGAYRLHTSSSELIEDELSLQPKDILVPASGCAYRKLNVWADAQVHGAVYDSLGEPVSGAPVQLFRMGEGGKFDMIPFAEVKTGGDGRYAFRRLEGGFYIVGVNGQANADLLPWRPTYYRERGRDRATLVTLHAGDSAKGIDLKLPRPRAPAVLQVEAALENGQRASCGTVRLIDLAGGQRAHRSGGEGSNAVEVPAFIGETYRVECNTTDGQHSFRGVSSPIRVKASPMRIRIALRRDETPPK